MIHSFVYQPGPHVRVAHIFHNIPYYWQQQTGFNPPVVQDGNWYITGVCDDINSPQVIKQQEDGIYVYCKNDSPSDDWQDWTMIKVIINH